MARWVVARRLAAVKEAPPKEDGEEIPRPLWQHEAISFDSQATHKVKAAPSLPDTIPRVVVQFDGACKRGNGGCGFAVFGPDG